MKKVIVLSLGGSLIINNKTNKINLEFLKDLKKIILKNTNKYKFVIITGGGKTARDYINGLEKQKNKKLLQSFLGISITRLNARFLTYFFNNNQPIPKDMKQIKNLLKKHKFIFCGALKYSKNQTSDTTSAKLAYYLKSDFINLTNVKGLYTKNPKKHKNAKFIPEISHKEFLKIANQIEFNPGQHFVLDQKAAKIIKKHNIKTYILGDVKQLNNLLNSKHFIGTQIG